MMRNGFAKELMTRELDTIHTVQLFDGFTSIFGALESYEGEPAAVSSVAWFRVDIFHRA